MKKLFFLLLGVLISFSTLAQDFTYEYEGQTLEYTILSETDKTCKLVTYDGESISGKVIIPSSVIYEEAEYTVTTIARSAFSFCENLTSINIPSTVTEIGVLAFYACGELTEINVDADNPNYRTVDGVVFNPDITTVLICPGGLEGDYKIPESVTTIDTSAFSACRRLTSVDIPSTVTTIGAYAFHGCKSLVSITIPADVTSIGEGAFWVCDNLVEIYYEAREPKKFSSQIFDTNIYNKATLYISPFAYDDCYRLTPWCNFKTGFNGYFNYEYEGVRLGYKIIDRNKMTCSLENFNMFSVVDVIIPTVVYDATQAYQVTAIGNNVFYGIMLPSIIIPNTIQTIGSRAFWYCQGLKSITIPNSVTLIGDEAFGNCKDLESILIDDASISIGERAFVDCKNLTSVILGNSVTSIGIGSFIGCEGLTCIEIPNSVTSIGDEAFLNCNNLKSLSIGNSVATIGYSAFNGCSSLESVEIPNSVISTGDWAFSNCSNLTSVTIGNLVTTIGAGSFSKCTSLTNIEIPSSVNTIGWQAFSGCSSLVSIEIPNSIILIDDNAFSLCNKLRAVYYNTEEPIETSANVFDPMLNATLFVPESCVERCRQINPWKNFRLIKPYQFDGLDDITVDIDKTAPCEVYNLSGVRVADSTEGLASGLYIVRQGSTVKKINIR